VSLLSLFDALKSRRYVKLKLLKSANLGLTDHGSSSSRPAQIIYLNMQTEIEAKFPDIDPVDLRMRLKKVGATQKHPEVLMKRKTFDLPDNRLYAIGGWIRVRDEGDQITLSYKQLKDRSLHGTKEVNVVVDDFDRTCQLLDSIGMIQKSFQETKREKWIYNDVEITIDTWPWVPTFVELEGPTEESVKKLANQLGLDWNKVMHGSVDPIYQMHYDFTDKEIDSWKTITFTPPPEWLLARKKSTHKPS